MVPRAAASQVRYTCACGPMRLKRGPLALMNLLETKCIRLVALLSLSLALLECRHAVELAPEHVEWSRGVGEPFCLAREGSPEVCSVSFVQLLAHPDQYNGKLVVVEGYMNLEFEGNGLYLNREMFLYGQTFDAFWVDVEGITIHPQSRQGYVSVRARFNGEKHGHFGMFAGALEQITAIEVLRRRAG